MTKKITVVSVITLLILAAVFFLRPKKSEVKNIQRTETEKTQTVEENKTGSSGVVPKNYRESSEKYKYQIDVSYPAFQNIADKNTLDSINSQINNRIQQEVDKYIAEARRNKVAAIFGYLTGNYTNSIEGNTLSVKMEMEKYLSGAAKAENYSFDLNYDLKTGKEIN